jgi:hypothetical protein
VVRHAHALVVLLIVAACSSDGRAPTSATAELDLFSGRPNPAWSLGEPEASSILAAWEALAPARPIPYPERLGYRGVVVVFDDGMRLTIADGIADLGGVARADPDRALERLVVTSGRGTVDDALLDGVLTGLG